MQNFIVCFSEPPVPFYDSRVLRHPNGLDSVESRFASCSSIGGCAQAFMGEFRPPEEPSSPLDIFLDLRPHFRTSNRASDGRDWQYL